MSGSDSETLTAALRRLADEHASGLLSVATPGRDVVLELADGVPVGIGPTHDASDRVGRDAGPSLVAAAVIDELVDHTVAAIVDGHGDWTWDVSSDADMMPVPQGLATELSRRAVDAAQALATLDPALVLQPGRDLEVTGEAARIRALFDGERSIAEVAAEAGVTVPACATVAAALVRAGTLSTGAHQAEEPSWSDTVAGAPADEDEDEPELWVMDEPDDIDEFDDIEEPDDVEEPDHEGSGRPEELHAEPAPAATDAPPEADAPPPASTPDDTPDDAPDAIPDAMEWIAGDEEGTAAASSPPASPADSRGSDNGWDDTGWLDDLEGSSEVRRREEAARVAEDGERGAPEDPGADPRSALSSMLSELQGSSSEVQPREQAPAARTAEDEEREAASRKKTDTGRKEPKAEPGEVAEFLRELSRLALDDD